jgi:hypothetical protein
MKNGSRFPLTLTLSLREWGQFRVIKDFLHAYIVNSVAGVFKDAANVSPSTWGECRGEGECFHKTK